MTQLYYRDLRHRIEALEVQYIPEPEPPLPTLICTGEDGLPVWVCIPTKFDWKRQEDQPIPPEILQFASPEAQAAYKAKTAQQLLRAPPLSEKQE